MTLSSRSLNSKNDSICKRQRGMLGNPPSCDLGEKVASSYPDDAVESVDGGEFKVQAEKVEREDAEHVSLGGKKSTKTDTERLELF